MAIFRIKLKSHFFRLPSKTTASPVVDAVFVVELFLVNVLSLLEQSVSFEDVLYKVMLSIHS